MDIKDRIKKLGRYFKEMQITTLDGSQVIYVVVNFPRNWIVDDEVSERFGVTVNEGHSVGEFYFCADMETGESAIFDAIDYSIEKMQDAIERAQLLAAKTKELKEIFENEEIPLESLRNLKILYGQETAEIVLPTVKRGRKPSETDTADNAGTVSENKEKVMEE